MNKLSSYIHDYLKLQKECITMGNEIRAIELSFNDRGYVMIPAEKIKKLVLNEVKVSLYCTPDGDKRCERFADEVELEIKLGGTEEVNFMEYGHSSCQEDLLDLLEYNTITHITIRYDNNFREEYIAACDADEDKFTSFQDVMVNDADGIVEIKIKVFRDALNNVSDYK